MDILLLVVALLMVAPDAFAQAVKAGFPDVSTFSAYAWVALWGMLGGLVSFYRKVKNGTARWLNVNELVGELTTSAFVGIITGLLCDAAGAPPSLTFALVGITGHMGGRAIFWFETAAQRAAEKRLGIEKTPEELK